jgi:hypothetical protein
MLPSMKHHASLLQASATSLVLLGLATGCTLQSTTTGPASGSTSSADGGAGSSGSSADDGGGGGRMSDGGLPPPGAIPQEFVGNWLYQEMSGSTSFTFRADGTGTYTDLTLLDGCSGNTVFFQQTGPTVFTADTFTVYSTSATRTTTGCDGVPTRSPSDITTYAFPYTYDASTDRITTSYLGATMHLTRQ